MIDIPRPSDVLRYTVLPLSLAWTLAACGQKITNSSDISNYRPTPRIAPTSVPAAPALHLQAHADTTAVATAHAEPTPSPFELPPHSVEIKFSDDFDVTFSGIPSAGNLAAFKGFYPLSKYENIELPPDEGYWDDNNTVITDAPGTTLAIVTSWNFPKDDPLHKNLIHKVIVVFQTEGTKREPIGPYYHIGAHSFKCGGNACKFEDLRQLAKSYEASSNILSGGWVDMRGQPMQAILRGSHGETINFNIVGLTEWHPNEANPRDHMNLDINQPLGGFQKWNLGDLMASIPQ